MSHNNNKREDPVAAKRLFPDVAGDLDAYERGEATKFSLEASHTKQTGIVSVELPIPPAEAMQAWVDFIWFDGGGQGKPTILRTGEANGRGSVRTPGYGLLEIILRVDPKENLIDYTITRGLPLKSHWATVHFGALDGGKRTKMSWMMRYTPRWYGVWIGPYIQHYLFPRFVDALKTYVQALEINKVAVAKSKVITST